MRARKALIAWTPRGRDKDTAGCVEIGPLDGGDWTRPYTSTGGAVFTATRELRGEAALAMVFIEFHTLVVRDGIKPDVAHKAFLAIDEYRKAIAPDISGADDPS